MNDKIKTLARMISTPEMVQGVWAMVKSDYPEFPKNACGATLSTFLKQAGFPQSFGTWAQTEINEALSEGWERLPEHSIPQVGDIFVCEDDNNNGATDHVGLVYSMAAGPHFWAIDNNPDRCNGGKPYLRNIGPGKYTPVEYFIRYKGE